VNRANLKFINLSTTTSQVSVRNINESEREGHKDRVSFNPFPLSNGHLDRVSFSSQSTGTQSSCKDHHTIGVSYLGYN
jgi:hypothetical protein